MSARVVTGVRRREAMTPWLGDLHWLPIPYIIDFKIAVLTHRCRNGCAPSYLTSLIDLRCTTRQYDRVLRSSTTPAASYDLASPAAHVKTYCSRVLANYALTVGNRLPVPIRSSPLSHTTKNFLLLSCLPTGISLCQS